MKKYSILYAYIISNAGDWLFKFAMPLYLYSLTKKAPDIAIRYALTFLPFILFTIPSGVLSDKLQKRFFMYILDIMGFISCILLYIIMNNNTNIIYIYILIFIISSINSVYHVVFQGSLPFIFNKNLKYINSVVSSSDKYHCI